MGDVNEIISKYRKQRLEKLAKRNDFYYVDLNDSQENKIIEFILSMPVNRQNILIFKNYYEHTFDEIGDIFNIENPKGEYLHLVGILSEFLNLDNALISDNSMEKVCEKAAKIINEKIYKELEMMKMSNRKNNKVLIFNTLFRKKIASIILIGLISSSLLVGANVYAEGKIFEWIVSTFDKYTSFSVVKENQLYKNDMNIEISYIPKGFELIDSMLAESSDTYYYNNGDRVLFIAFIYDDIAIYIDTENVEKDKFEIEENIVTTWRKSGENYFVFSKDGVACQVYGNINRDEFIKIYNGILLKRK